MSLRTASRAPASADEIYAAIYTNIERVLRGQHHTVRLVLAALGAGGHVLLEDVPGTGKTTLAKALARSLEAEFQRIQFTPDLLPADILGVSIFERQGGDFRFRPGPVFTDVLLADEINRASPRTQSALLEAMGERQVSLDGTQHSLGETFFVLATQNPIDFEGTYPLPESQMDRFMLRLAMGYVGVEEEVAILSDRAAADPLDALRPCASRDDVARLRQSARAIRVSEELKHYMVTLVAATRGAEGVRVGASPRASLAVMRVSQALALFDGVAFVTPEHILEIAQAVIAHRLVLEPEALYGGLTGEQVMTQVLSEVEPPG